MILDFFKAAANLKNVARQGWIEKAITENPESVADHSYSMAIISMIFADLENYNSEKILKMVLLHDLAESITGDITPEKMSKQEKIDLENNAFEKIISNLPESLSKEYLMIWKDYQENNSKEANLVHQIDKLEMTLQAKLYEKHGISKEKLKSFYDSANFGISEPKLKEVFTKIMND
ncbi:MAG: HD domain-containing protein [Nitrosopumilus sp.]|nr:HD domain-containing protein [Nitrosopumilus sp.]